MKPAILHGLATASLLLGLSAGAHAQAPAQLTYQQPLAPPAVHEVQDRLRQAGVFTGASDGVWGPDSQSALQQYQQTHGLQVTGQLNQATATMLGVTMNDMLAVGAPPPPPAPVQGPLSPASISRLQARLAQLGYYRGGVDGVWGSEMENALTRFQQASGNQVTGRLNPQTVTAMGMDPNTLTMR